MSILGGPLPEVEEENKEPNYIQVIEEAFPTTTNLTGRALHAQKLRNKRIAEGNTGIPISEVPKLAWDTGVNMAESMASDPAAMSEHTLELFADFQAASKGAQAGSKFGPWGAGGGAVGAVILRRGGKELVEKVFSLVRKGDQYIDAATGMKVDPTDSTYFMSKGSGPELPPFSKKLNEQAAANQQSRIDEASKALKKKNLKDRKQFASVLKRRIRTYVEEFKGSDADINDILSETNRIYKSESIRHIDARKSVRWLNSYFKKLGQEVSEDGLSMRQLRIADVNGKPRLVHDNASGKGIKIYKSAFEKDHVKAKTIFERLARQSDNPELFAGADFSENLDVVLTVFNRAKKDFDVQGVSIPDEVLRATGSSTSLRELVRRNLDPKFDAQFQRIPERFRNVAKNQMIEDIVYAKSKSLTQLGIKRIVNKHLKWWDEFGETMVQLDDYVPSDVLKQLNEIARQNPQDALLELQKTPIWSKLSKSLKTRWQNLSDRFVNLEGGLRRRPKGKFYDENY